MAGSLIRRFLILTLVFAVSLGAIATARYAYNAVRPSPELRISKQTTYITSPLTTDGEPDYETYLLEQRSLGATPDNNAAVLMWQAVWPGEIEQEHRPLVATALGIEEPQQPGPFVSVNDEAVVTRVAGWLMATSGDKTLDEAGYHQAAERLIELCQHQPWTGDQCPPLAEWAEQNNAALEMIAEASKRSRYFSPSGSLLDGKRELLVGMLVPDLVAIRDINQSLAVVGMLETGENNLSVAANYSESCRRLADLLAAQKSPLLIEQLYALKLYATSYQLKRFIIESSQTIEVKQKLLQSLIEKPPGIDVRRSIETAERITALNASLDTKAFGEPFDNRVVRSRVDWNNILGAINKHYDTLADIASMEERDSRVAVSDKLEAEVVESAKKWSPASYAYGLWFEPKIWEEAIATLTLCELMPAVVAAKNAEDRIFTNHQLAIVASALAVYRERNKHYPTQLESLVPDYLAELPLDRFSKEPLRYSPRDNGYVLYSVDIDGTDDGGSDGKYIVNGEWDVPEWSELGSEEMSESVSLLHEPGQDLVIRVPVPQLAIP